LQPAAGRAGLVGYRAHVEHFLGTNAHWRIQAQSLSAESAREHVASPFGAPRQSEGKSQALQLRLTRRVESVYVHGEPPNISECQSMAVELKVIQISARAMRRDVFAPHCPTDAAASRSAAVIGAVAIEQPKQRRPFAVQVHGVEIRVIVVLF